MRDEYGVYIYYRFHWLRHKTDSMLYVAALSKAWYDRIFCDCSCARWDCTRNVRKIYLNFGSASGIRTWFWSKRCWYVFYKEYKPSWNRNPNTLSFLRTQLEWLLVSHGIVQAIFAILIAYWGSRVHKITWLCSMLIIQSIASLIVIIPTLVHGYVMRSIQC